MPAGGQPWPPCFCGRPMVLFCQVDVPAFRGDHLPAVQCPLHDDAAYGPPALPDR